MDGNLQGKVALVTGAARGLGAEFCTAFAAQGVAVVAGDLRDCGETIAAVTEAGGRGLAVTLDVTSAQSAQAAADAAVKAFGRIDVLINNAAMFGNLHTGRFESLDEGEWDACMAVNVKGLWQCAKAAVPAMRQAGGGSIISLSSVTAIMGRPNNLHYAASKGAVIGFTRGLARELGRDNIRVNAIAPSLIMTPGAEEVNRGNLDKAAEFIRNNQTLRSKNLESQDIVGTALFLASDMSRFITGQTLMVDGGTVYK